MRTETFFTLSNAKLVSVDAEKLVRQIDLRLRLEVPELSEGPVRFYSGLPEGDGTARVQELLRNIEAHFVPAVGNLGEAPPRPATLRGFLGALAIRFLRPLLWWYTCTLRNFASSAVSQSYRELEVLRFLADELASTREEVAALRKEVRRVREAAASGGGSAR
jgi:hypothetical protein